MAYLPNSDEDRQAMLATLGLTSPEELFATVPRRLLDPPIELPPPLGEQGLIAELRHLAARNHPAGELDSFLGAGVYWRHIPAIVSATIGRPEFFTAYTPYQAEASQGTLQTIFEFQSLICGLVDLDVANASMYDGATSAAEAALLSVGHTGRRRLAVSAGVHPETLAVLRTYVAGRDVAIDLIPLEAGRTTADAVAAVLGDDHAALLVAQPNFDGSVEHLAALAQAAHARGALAVVSADPIAAAALVPPGEAGVDVAVGECQPLGIPMSFGGPHCGYIAARQALLRRLPGRLCGLTRDAEGRRAYALTLQTREQHIRREHATSNICTNHALMALAATVYMARMGLRGMRCVAEISARRAHALAARLSQLDGWALSHPQTPFLFEFCVSTPTDAEAVAAELRKQGIVAGLPLGRIDPSRSRELLVCCTEMTEPAAIDRYVEGARRLARRPATAGAAR